jgi:hypothetical protein
VRFAVNSAIPESPSIGAASSKTTGDGLLVEFANLLDAVRCAVELQREMSTCNAAAPAQRRIEFRMGINKMNRRIDARDRCYWTNVHWVATT